VDEPLLPPTTVSSADRCNNITGDSVLLSTLTAIPVAADGVARVKSVTILENSGADFAGK